MTTGSREVDRTTVVVLGMHRSGTSLVSGLVQALGVFGGDDAERLPGDDWNARGYFEVRAVVDIDRRLMLAEGFDLSLPPIGLGWEPSPDDDGASESDARALVDSFSTRGDGQWVWKDPRFALTLPWWRRLLGRVVPILCLRHPSAVAASLARRDRFPVDGSVKLWEVYLRQALWNCRDLDWLPVQYDDVVGDPVAVARTMHAFLLERGVRIGPLDEGSIASQVSGELRHFVAADDTILCERQTRLLRMAGEAQVDEDFLRATAAECLQHRPALLELTVRSLRDELGRSHESDAFHRQHAAAIQTASAAERAFLREQVAGLQRDLDATLTGRRELEAWVEDRNAAIERLTKRGVELEAWIEDRNAAIEWWRKRSVELEASVAEQRERADALAAQLDVLRHQSFLRRLFSIRRARDLG